MYAWLWRALPGRPGVRVLEMVALALILLLLLWFWGFPWLSDAYSAYSVALQA